MDGASPDERPVPRRFRNGGSPHIYVGEERVSAPEKATPLTARFSAGQYRAPSKLLSVWPHL